MDSVLYFEYPKHVRFTCERCATCCGDTKERVRMILLLKIEAQHISRETLKCIDEFAEKIEGSEPYVHRMKKTDDGKCVFLRDNSCSIYQMRPLICRFYPFQLKYTRSNRPVFTYTNECPGIGNGPELKRGFYEKLLEESVRLMEKTQGISDE